MEGLSSFGNSRKMKSKAKWERVGRRDGKTERVPPGRAGLQWITRRRASWGRVVGRRVSFGAAQMSS